MTLKAVRKSVMNKNRALQIILLIVPVLSLYAFAIPETAITRTHLMKDIDKSSITIGAGLEAELTENPVYSADWLFGNFGYAPLDWLEFGVAIHVLSLIICPSVEAKIDLVDIFTDFSHFSCILMGGIGGFTDDEEFYLIYHGGMAVNLRLNQYWQLYLGAGSDSLSEALKVQLSPDRVYFLSRSASKRKQDTRL